MLYSHRGSHSVTLGIPLMSIFISVTECLK
uniref:Uncharacterized protein n=1 Tax=Anguilla anguilla TaxID=7936 RepID=A0A0E9UM88_ANGAN